MRKPTTQLGTAVRRRRKVLRWTQSRLASEVGRTLQWVSQIETGTRLTNEDVIVELATALDLQADDLLRLLKHDRASQGGGPPPADSLSDSLAALRASQADDPAIRQWAMWISGRGFPTHSNQDDVVNQLIQAAASGLDVVFCPVAASIGARTDATRHAPWMTASTLQGDMDVMLHDASASNAARPHMWLLAEPAPGNPSSTALFAEYAQLLLVLQSPCNDDTASDCASPPPCTGENVDVIDAWVRIQIGQPHNNAGTWIRIGGDRSQQTYSARHWIAAMHKQGTLTLDRLFEWAPPVGTDA